ncbi:MAG: hypothetical protein LC130_26690 [Bryobacterales bacterium]|nr:hypothetical protein [Bryobacterales bacterium]
MKRFLMISGLLVTFLALHGAAQRGMRAGGMGMGGGMRGGAMGAGGMQNGSMRGNRGTDDARIQHSRDHERRGMQSGQNTDAASGRQQKHKRARGSQRDGATTEQH